MWNVLFYLLRIWVGNVIVHETYHAAIEQLCLVHFSVFTCI